MSFDQSIEHPSPARDEQSQDAQQERPDEMSGQWIRDQLRAVATEPETPSPSEGSTESSTTEQSSGEQGTQGEAPGEAGPPPEYRTAEAPSVIPASDLGAAAAGSDGSLSPIVANLARSISDAVAKPLQDFESRREAEASTLVANVREQSNRIDSVFSLLRRLEETHERLSESVGRQETAAKGQLLEVQTQMESLRADVKTENQSMGESLGALRGELEGFAARLSNAESALEQQRSAVARLETLERRRGDALGEMSRLVGGIQQALQPLAAQEDDSNQ